MQLAPEFFEQYAPYIVIIILFIIQNNIFVRPEALERKHREILKEVEESFESKYVEINAYKEFQNHIYSKLDEVKEQNDEIKALLMKRRKDD